ncbi:hypothetical protein I3271_05325 [Photobacterium leiognathi]|uniref:hypothetical protein n=1 Tax=Photobacterium leiognathi TaxID=553611 RepID=UPI001EDCD890|nr:hypothetical protein [Photobacterium leiognathi]MCG3884101.1 hypothetical protein [Photobacterium leiognathi]
MCELFETCIHEAGHLFVLRHFGGDGYIEIFDNPINTELEKDILGRVRCTKQPLKIHQTTKTNILVGLAGHCAELLHFNPETEWLAYELQDFWEYEFDSISNSDRNLTKHAVFDDFFDCADLITNNYGEILDIAKAHFMKCHAKEKPIE